MKIVSACLAGIPCRYDGSSKPCKKVIDLVSKNEAIPVCPEQLAGLPIPRGPFEIFQGKVINSFGEDYSFAFNRGAQEALKIAKLVGAKEAILKSKSPSCGCGKIYDGTFKGVLVNGDGVLTQMLKKEGIKCLTEEDEF